MPEKPRPQGWAPTGDRLRRAGALFSSVGLNGALRVRARRLQAAGAPLRSYGQKYGYYRSKRLQPHLLYCLARRKKRRANPLERYLGHFVSIRPSAVRATYARPDRLRRGAGAATSRKERAVGQHEKMRRVFPGDRAYLTTNEKITASPSPEPRLRVGRAYGGWRLPLQHRNIPTFLRTKPQKGMRSIAGREDVIAVKCGLQPHIFRIGAVYHPNFCCPTAGFLRGFRECTNSGSPLYA